MTTPVSTYKFAQLAGCTREMVEKAINMGHLEDAVSRTPEGYVRIDPELGRRNWARNWAETGNSTPRLKEFLKGALETPHSGSGESRAAGVARPTWGKLSVSEARRIKEEAKAKDAQLDLEQRMGTLVHIDDVRAAQFEMGRVIRTSFETLSSTLAPELGLTHAQQVGLDRAIAKRLESLSELDRIEFKPKRR